MTFEIIFVLLALLGMVVALALDKCVPAWCYFPLWFCSYVPAS